VVCNGRDTALRPVRTEPASLAIRGRFRVFAKHALTSAPCGTVYAVSQPQMLIVERNREYSRRGPVIDLHCHILPALDDGAIDLEDSVAMARQAEADGIEVVCATPHIRSDHDVVPDELEGRIAAVNDELERQGLKVRVAHGGEVADEALEEVADEKLRCVSLGKTGIWLLVEPRPGPITGDLIDTVDQLAKRNFRCVIAHPERHAGADFRERLEALVERGALIQVTSK